MKKLLVLVPLFIMLAFSAMAQQGGQGQGAAQFVEMQKQRLKDSLGLTPVQIDSVMAVQLEFQPQTREIRRNQSMSETDKESKLKAISDARHKRLAAALNNEALATKIEEFNERSMQRMRGGNRQRNNN